MKTALKICRSVRTQYLMLKLGVGMPEDELVQSFDVLNVVKQLVAKLFCVVVADFGVTLKG
jgi:hypothetical protein